MPELANPLALGHLRRENTLNLPHAASVQAASTSSAAGGRLTAGAYAERVALPCRLSLASEADQAVLLAGGVRADRAYVVIFPAGADVRLHDHLVVTGSTMTDAGAVAFSHTCDVKLVAPQDRAGEVLRRVVAIEVAP